MHVSASSSDSRPANIGLQRTSAFGLAAEAGSFGGSGRVGCV
jgi:hypothetical protein